MPKPSNMKDFADFETIFADFDSRRSLTTSLRFIKVYYNQLLVAKIIIFFHFSKKSLIKYTFICICDINMEKRHPHPIFIVRKQ